jgi:ribonuclease BN (tRNA processing enzyme)
LEKPSLKFINLEPFVTLDIEGYKVIALPVRHTMYAVGFEITSKDGKKIFYSGDTGPGLLALWEHISPDLIIVEVTFPNRLDNRAINAAHLCPKMFKKELIEFFRIKGYFPKVILVHLSPRYEKEIKNEIKKISKDLKLSIGIASEGDELII